MADKTTIGISSLIALGLIAASMIAPGFFQEPKYYCESESSIISCQGGLSGGSQTRCYLNEEKTSWDYCSTGWVEVTNDLQIQEEPVSPSMPAQGQEGYGNARQWQCSTDGCVQVA